MRITLVSETYFPQINGVSRTLDQLTSYLHDQGDQLQLLCPRYGEEPENGDRFANLTPFRAFELPRYREILLPFTTPGQLRQAYRAFAPDLVHIATEGPLGWAALRAARSEALPLVSSYHTNFSSYLQAYGLGLLAPLSWRYLRWFHNATAATLCPTPSIAELLRQRGFANLQLWGRGVDGELFHPGKRSPELRRQLGFADHDTVFVYAGRLAAEKNLSMLVEAFRLLDRDDARLLLIGDGPLRRTLEAREDRRIVFAGYRRGEELAQAYASADVKVFPSLTDTFGNVMLEALASGLPVLGFDVPGPKDVIREGQTGELVGEISAAALAGTMRRWLKSSIELQPFATRARREAQARSWPAINAEVRELYQQLLVRRSAAQRLLGTPARQTDTKRC